MACVPHFRLEQTACIGSWTSSIAAGASQVRVSWRWRPAARTRSPSGLDVVEVGEVHLSAIKLWAEGGKDLVDGAEVR